MNSPKFKTAIGIEVHLQLNTETKAFCGCPNTYGAPPNTNTCPICLGHPGTLPSPNREVLNLALTTALALNCYINKHTIYERKNYFYPDLPKGFQISQYELPIGYDGHLEFFSGDDGDRPVRWGIERVHLEEDTAKLFHEDGKTLLDFNRAGIPLMEVVSKPMISTPEEAYYYLRALRSTLLLLGVSDCSMEEGSLRCDTNISVSDASIDELGTKVEVKNINSFRYVRSALEFERKRQMILLENGEEVVQETRLWDEVKRETRTMRGKEESADYRYFPEPDIPPLTITDEWLSEIEGEIPPLHKERLEEIMEFSIGYQEAVTIADRPEMYDYYRRSLNFCEDGKSIINYLLGDISSLVRENGLTFDEVPIKPEYLAKLVMIQNDGKISSKIAKTVLQKIWDTGKSPEVIIEEESLSQISDDDELLNIIKGVIDQNPGAVESYLGGKEKAVGALIGEVMKETRGRADPQKVSKILIDILNEMR